MTISSLPLHAYAMSFLKLPSFNPFKARADTDPHAADIKRPTLSLHVPAFGGIVMKSVSDPSTSASTDPTILAGQVEIYLATEQGLMCEGLSVWIEARWTDVEGKKDKGTTFGFKIYLPSTLPRNGRTPHARMMYWLVATIDGLTDQRNPVFGIGSTNASTSVTFSSSGKAQSTSKLPSYDETGSDIEWLRGSVRSERRIAVSHNPNPDGGVSRLDDDFAHDLVDFGTCRIQVRVNEWCIGCSFPLRLTCIALSPLATLFAIRVKLLATTVITPPSTGRPTTVKETFIIIEQGRVPSSLSIHPPSEFSALWRGKQAGGEDQGDFTADLAGKLPICNDVQPTTLPGMHMPGVGVPIRGSHKLVYEVFFSVFGKTGEGAQMPYPGQGGIQLMRRALDVVLPQCVFVSEVLNLPSYSTVFGENIRRTDEYFFHRIEANLPCPTCNLIPLHNLCTTCPAGIASHIQHSMPQPVFVVEGSRSKSKGAQPVPFDPSCESCPTCSGKSVLPVEDPNYHLCGCEIEGRDAAYRVVWDEARPTIVKEATQRGN